MKKTSRILALILVLAFCFTCMAVSVFAGGGKLELDDGELTNSGAGIGGNPSGTTNPDTSETPSATPDKTEGEGGKTEQTNPPAPAPAPTSKPVVEHATKYVPDVSGHFRTSAAKIIEKVKPAAIARQNLYVDPVTNTVVNLYDADGNLIPATLSSDGHFYIIPSNDGCVYIPVA